MLNNNILESLPESIGNVLQLKSLDICSNKLTELPKNLGNLVQLESLDIMKNQLTQLPESIGNLSGIKDHIYAYENPLSSIPASASNLAVKVLYSE
ncbi:MAG: hypothetical protein H0X31_19535 [Nostocaceae cyanobacterium]|nr:hypothetical protein [Nostocaceae cyanobacterium]